MTVKYYAILTNQGAARLANATMLGSKLNLTQMAVGDANGVLPTPDPAQTKLINQKRIAPLNLLSVDPNNQSQIIAEQIIPENEGGFWIREIGLYDDEGVLIAVANCPETYKPQLQEGSGRTQTIRMILVVTNTEAITLKIDPSVVLATRKYVDDEVLELKLYVDDQMRNHIAAQDPHTQYAQKHNPTFTGEPKAPTPAAGNNTTRIATTAFVQAAITALINGAPATLDTLKEIAAAINNDPKFSTTINNALSGKQPLDETLTHLSGKDVAGLLAYLGLGEGSALPVGAPVPWPSETPPTGWLKCNGAAFSAEEYPELAKAYPTNKLPDLRGEFIRGWDDSRGIDTGRSLLSGQAATFIRTALQDYYGYDLNTNVKVGIAFATADSVITVGNPANPKAGNNSDYVPASADNSITGTQRTAEDNFTGAWISMRPRNLSFNYIVRAA
ncbi:phage tail protein [Escherichia coli]|uniref:phage tail protein n=7 Tax=Escherichia coli TaxID=562 RepID=UPI000BCA84F8|nr:phage tail protein [Escherichia coli]TLI07720.1 phage tail protein [Escherichia coli O25b:H4]HBN2402781.1 phage tail protein [Escherichia coli O25b:H4-ST131]EFE4990561.1 phage tail protein [Escherichia coli]EHH3405532.1 phage tail protein [Escherichia coli]EIN0469093.1 phage tail protein [Escherichia coli]